MTVPSIILFVVDDDDIYKFTISRTIEMQKIPANVIHFSDGAEAFRFIEENIKSPELLPDVILLDINMPAMDGWQFLEEYSRVKPALKKPVRIYLVTSSVDRRDISRAKTVPEISDYLVKPVRPELLRDIISGTRRFFN